MTQTQPRPRRRLVHLAAVLALVAALVATFAALHLYLGGVAQERARTALETSAAPVTLAVGAAPAPQLWGVWIHESDAAGGLMHQVESELSLRKDGSWRRIVRVHGLAGLATPREISNAAGRWTLQGDALVLAQEPAAGATARGWAYRVAGVDGNALTLRDADGQALGYDALAAAAARRHPVDEGSASQPVLGATLGAAGVALALAFWARRRAARRETRA